MIVTYNKRYGSGHREGYAFVVTGVIAGQRGVKGFAKSYLREGENDLAEGTLIIEVNPGGSVKHPKQYAQILRVSADGQLEDADPEREEVYDWAQEYLSIQARVKQLLTPPESPEPTPPAVEVEEDPLASVETEALIRALEARGCRVVKNES
jgi:hypothetical protein